MGQLLDPTPSDQLFVVCLARLAQASKMGQLADERFRNAQHADGARGASLPRRAFKGKQRIATGFATPASPFQA
jgi:hypothetical protein